MKLTRTLIASGLIASTGPLAAGQSFSVVGRLATGTYTRTVDVSNNGSFAAGYSDDGGSMRTFEWLWTTNITFVSYNGLPGGGYFTMFPASLDGAGFYVCGFGDRLVTVPPFNNQVGPRAYREQLNSGVNNTQVQMLPYANFSDARGISDDGNIVVGRQFTNALEFAYRYTYSTSQLQDLGWLSGQTGAAALAVSGDGNTVVGRSGTQAFSWRPGEGMLSLGSLPGQSSAVATCVGYNGLTICGVSNNGLDRGFRWSPLVGMQQVPNLGGDVQLRPHAMDSYGQIIGGQSVDAAGVSTAFIWTPVIGTQTAISHLAGRGLYAQFPVGLTLTDVTGMSPDGKAMCGLGLMGSTQVGWVARGLQCTTMTGNPTTVNACPGGNVTLNANGAGGTGSGLSWFRWYHNGVHVSTGTQPGGSYIPNSNAFNLEIWGVTAADLGQYECFVSAAGACEVEGPFTTLQFASVPAINLQPQNTTACASQVVTFTTSATASQGTVVYRWQRHVPPNQNVWADINDGPTGTGAAYSGTHSGTFSVQNAQVGDSERYRCLVSDSACGSGNNASTNQVLLTVNGPTTLVGPFDTHGCYGDNDAALVVTATPGAIAYQWQRRVTRTGYANIFDGPTGNGGYYGGTQTAMLTVNQLNPGDMTYYRCIVTGPCDTVTSGPALITGLAVPSVVTQPSEAYVCSLAGTGTMTVAGSNDAGSLTYQWYGPTGQLVNGPTTSGHVYFGVTSPTMTVTSTTTAAAGLYYCRIGGECGDVYTNSAPLVYCPGDFNCDGSADFFDYVDFVDAYSMNAGSADFNHDDAVDFFDYLDFVDAFTAGC